MKYKDLKYYNNEVISMGMYFYQYHNFPDEFFKNFSHSDVKKNFPFIEMISLDKVNREDILTGKMLIVKDYTGKVEIYKNPFTYENVIDELENIKNNDKVEIIFTVEDEINDLLYDEKSFENLSVYQLEQILKTAKENNEFKISKMVQRELYFNKDNHNNKNLIRKQIIDREIRKGDLND